MSDYDLTEMGRQISNMARVGKIVELDAANARVKVSVAGLTTDWLPWSASRAGATRQWSPPKVGEQVVMLSPYGDMAQAVVMGSVYQDDHPAPATSGDQETIAFVDGTVVDFNGATHTMAVTMAASGHLNVTISGAKIEASSSSIKLTVGGVTLEVSSGGIAMTGGTVTHNGKNIGATHVHGGVTPGGADTLGPH